MSNSSVLETIAAEIRSAVLAKVPWAEIDTRPHGELIITWTPEQTRKRKREVAKVEARVLVNPNGIMAIFDRKLVAFLSDRQPCMWDFWATVPESAGVAPFRLEFVIHGAGVYDDKVRWFVKYDKVDQLVALLVCVFGRAALD